MAQSGHRVRPSNDSSESQPWKSWKVQRQKETPAQDRTVLDGQSMPTSPLRGLSGDYVGPGMLRQVLLLQRDVPKATKFYQDGLGLKVMVLTERWAELDAGSVTVALKAVEGYGISRFAAATCSMGCC